MSISILVIDDSEDDQHLYRRALRESGWSLEMASSAEDGFARMAADRHDLILLDYNLPDADGLSFMKRLATHADTPIPIVMLTGEGSTAVAVEAMKHGAEDYLVKDTEGLYLRLLPGVLDRVMQARAQRERAERLQRETERLLHRNHVLMQASMDGIHVLDMRGRLVEANDAFCRMLGYTWEEMAGFGVADWDAQWSDGEMQERRKELVGKSDKFETVHRRKDGSLIHVEVSLSGTEVDGQHLFFAASRDITERKKAETALLRHKRVLETSIDGFWMTDMQGYLLEANEAYARMSGYTVAELAGMHISQLEAIETEPAMVHAHIAQLVAQGHLRFETRHRHKDGREIDIEVSCNHMAEAQQLVVFCRDITERKKAETVLRQHKLMLDTSIDGFCVVDMQGNLLEANEAYAKLSGYTIDELCRMHISQLDALENAADVKNHIAEIMVQGYGQFETRHRHKDGHKIDVEISATYIADLQKLVAFCRDISERKHAEEEQRLSAQLLNSTSDSIFLIDLDGNFVYLNEAAWKTRGYSRDELMAMNVRELNSPESARLIAPRVKELLENGHGIFETEHRCKDGSIISVEVSSRVVEFGGRKLFLSSSRDITERKKTEAVLRQYKLVLDTSIDGFWVTDLQGYLLEANEAYAKISGYTVAELMGMHISQLEAIELKPEIVAAHIARVVEQGSDRFETRHRHKDGHEIDIEVSCTHVTEPQRLVVFCRDISERKRASLALQHNQDLLNHAQQLGKLGSWKLDLLSGVLHWSHEMYRIFELDPARFPSTYEGFLDVIHPEDRDKVNQAYTQSLQDRQPYDVVHRLLFADGRIKWVREHCTTAFDASGKPLRSEGMTQDITERKEAEAALFRNEANLRAILDNSPFLTWLKDADSRYITVNKAFADYLRLDDSSQVAGKTDLDLQPQELAEKYRADDAAVMAARQRKHVEEAAFDGTRTHWVETYKTPIIDSKGNMLGTAGFAMDITERKRMQLETEALLRRNQALMKTSMDGIHVLDMQGNVVEANEAFCQMLGYSLEEAASLNVADWAMEFSGAELRLRFVEHIDKSVMLETVHRRKDGTLINVEISVTGEMIDGQGLLFCSSRDITARKKAEQEMLLESAAEHRRAEMLAQQFGHLLQNSFNEIYLFDAQSMRFLQVSEGAKRNLGYSADELAQLTLLDLKPAFTQDSYESLMAPLIRGEQQSLLFETVNRRKDGTTYPVEVRLQLMEADSPVFLSIVQDITGRKHAEQQTRELSAHLQAVREEEKASFAREIHDELGSTLAALKMDASWLARTLPAEEELLPLRKCVESMSGLLDNAVLATRRIITDLRPTMLDDLGLFATLKWQADQFQKRTGIACRVVCTCGEGTGCEEELDQVVSINLFRIFQEALTNVARHSGASRVEAEFGRSGKEVFLSICDNGCGLPEGHTIASTSFGMRGMRERVAQLGGQVSFDSMPGGGLGVTVVLPLPSCGCATS